jgi:hypothetical protein
VFIRREDAERFIEEVRGDDPVMAEKLRIEERELEVGGVNLGETCGLESLASATREAELVAKSTLPVPPDEPANERVAPLGHETSLSLTQGDATQRVHIAATVDERVGCL